jgi:hypothetical protein
MHVAIAAPADTNPGLGMFTGEDGATLAAEIMAYLAMLGPTVGLADASIAAVGGGRLYAVDLTLKSNNGGGSSACPAAQNLDVRIFTGETEAELEAARVAAYASPTFPTPIFLDKIAAASNGRHFMNLQIGLVNRA